MCEIQGYSQEKDAIALVVYGTQNADDEEGHENCF